MSEVEFFCNECSRRCKYQHDELVENDDGNLVCKPCGDAIDFPVERTVYLHDEHATREQARELFAKDDVRDTLFRNFGYEVEVEMKVFEDGAYDILSVDGEEL